MNRIFQLHADICKTFSNPIRLEILNLLRGGELTVSALIEKTGYSQANVSQHLSVMKGRGIVLSRKEGQNVYYKLSTQKIVRAFDLIREILRERLEKDKKLAKGA